MPRSLWWRRVVLVALIAAALCSHDADSTAVRLSAPLASPGLMGLRSAGLTGLRSKICENCENCVICEICEICEMKIA